MRIEVKKIESFLKAATINGKISQIGLHFENNGVSMRGFEPANVGGSICMLKRTAFQSYQAHDGVIGLDLPTSKVLGMLKLFKGIVDINIVKLGDKPVALSVESTDPSSTEIRKFPIITDINYISGYMGELPPTLSKYDNGITISCTELEKVSQVMSALNLGKLQIEIHNGNMHFFVGESEEDCWKRSIACDYHDVKPVLYATLFQDIITVLNGNVNLAFYEIEDKTGPIRLRMDNDDMQCTFIIAPLELIADKKSDA